jgi:ubiquinone biosynthesis protein Coq4
MYTRMGFFKKLKLIIRGLYLSFKLLIRPEDLQTLIKLGDVFTELPAYEAALAQLKSDPEAATLIYEKYSPGIPSMEELKNFPKDTLGYAYYAHLSKNKIDPYISKPCLKKSDRLYLRERQREIHDILHAILDVGIDIPDEGKLNSMFMVKGASPFTTVLVVGSFFHFIFKRPTELPKLIENVRSGWEIGKKAKSPFAIRWEDRFSEPIEQVRKDFGIN